MWEHHVLAVAPGLVSICDERRWGLEADARLSVAGDKAYRLMVLRTGGETGRKEEVGVLTGVEN